jgi:hypothetical protein
MGLAMCTWFRWVDMARFPLSVRDLRIRRLAPVASDRVESHPSDPTVAPMISKPCPWTSTRVHSAWNDRPSSPPASTHVHSNPPRMAPNLAPSAGVGKRCATAPLHGQHPPAHRWFPENGPNPFVRFRLPIGPVVTRVARYGLRHRRRIDRSRPPYCRTQPRLIPSADRAHGIAPLTQSVRILLRLAVGASGG